MTSIVQSWQYCADNVHNELLQWACLNRKMYVNRRKSRAVKSLVWYNFKPSAGHGCRYVYMVSDATRLFSFNGRGAHRSFWDTVDTIVPHFGKMVFVACTISTDVSRPYCTTEEENRKIHPKSTDIILPNWQRHLTRVKSFEFSVWRLSCHAKPKFIASFWVRIVPSFCVSHTWKRLSGTQGKAKDVLYPEPAK